MYNILKTITSVFFILLTATSFAQDVVIDYSTWVWSTDPNAPPPPCNIFGSAINVPATIDGTSGAIQHQTQIGQPIWTTTNKYVEMACTYVSSTSILGTKYRINYNFKAGAKYIITVNAAAKTGSTNGTGPNLRLDLTNAGGGGGTACNGPASIDPNTSGNPAAQRLNSTTYSDVSFAWAAELTSGFPTLEVSSIPTTNGGTNAIRIKKITIDETVPISNPSFSLSPTSVSKVCGTALSQTFTVTNVNNTPGVTGYIWNLGTATNGWNYNGFAAPQTITTTTNTITLTAAACTNALQNVTATAKIGTAGYSTNSSSVSLISPSMSLSVVNPLCTTGTFSISNVPCNSTVSWVSSNTNVISVPATGNPVTATKVNAGNATITATVNSCGQSLTFSKTVHAGGYSSGDYVISGPSSTCAFRSVSYSVNILPGATGYSWLWPSNFTYQNGGNGYSYLNLTAGSSSSGGGQVGVRVANACDAGGSYSMMYTQVNNCGFSITASPNPTADEVNIAVAEPQEASTLASANKKKTTMYQIKVMDQSGNLKKQFKYSSGVSNTRISLGGLNKGMYTIQAFDGKSWGSVKVIKQ